MLSASLPVFLHAAGPASSGAVATDRSFHAVQADVFRNADAGGRRGGPLPAIAAVGLRGDGVPTGFAALDRRLPAGGWPRRALTEVRWAVVGSATRAAATSAAAMGTAATGVTATGTAATGATATGTDMTGNVTTASAVTGGVMTGTAATAGLDAGSGSAGTAGLADTDTAAVLRLVAPSIAAALDAGRTVMLFDPPADCSAGLLARCGIDAAALLVVDGRDGARPGARSLWLMERALASGEVGAVLGWLPAGLPDGPWQRLRQAARQHDGAAFVVVEPDRRTASDRMGVPAGGDRGDRTAGCDAPEFVPSSRLGVETGDRLLLRLIAGTGDHDDAQGDGPVGVGVGVGVAVILDGVQDAGIGAPALSRPGRAHATQATHRGGMVAALTVLAGGLQRYGLGSATAPRSGDPHDAGRRVVPRLATASLALDLPPLRPAASCPSAAGEPFGAAVFVDLGG